MKKITAPTKEKSREPVSEISALKTLKTFLDNIKKDPRIRAMHISVYMALYELWISSNCPESLNIISHQIMPAAKISSNVTWHRTIRDLHDFGYLKYQPSFNRMSSSKVYIEVKTAEYNDNNN